MSNLPPSRAADKIIIRLPDGMRDRLHARAENNGRSMTAEVVAMLQQVMDDPDSLRMVEIRNELDSLRTTMSNTATHMDEIAQRKRLEDQEIADSEARSTTG